MLYWSVFFLVVALVAGLLGFGGLAAASAGVARAIFSVFLLLFIVSFVIQLINRT